MADKIRLKKRLHIGAEEVHPNTHVEVERIGRPHAENLVRNGAAEWVRPSETTKKEEA